MRMSEVVSKVQKGAYTAYFSKNPGEYRFLLDACAAQYRADLKSVYIDILSPHQFEQGFEFAWKACLCDGKGDYEALTGFFVDLVHLMTIRGLHT